MKLDRNKTNYLKAGSYDVVVEVVYQRTRRVRALDEEQAKVFAEKREEGFARRRYDKMNKIAYDVMNVSSVKVTQNQEKKDG
jgi:hypothetical protein